MKHTVGLVEDTFAVYQTPEGKCVVVFTGRTDPQYGEMTPLKQDDKFRVGFLTGNELNEDLRNIRYDWMPETLMRQIGTLNDDNTLVLS